jgi:hypothetical protein
MPGISTAYGTNSLSIHTSLYSYTLYSRRVILNLSTGWRSVSASHSGRFAPEKIIPGTCEIKGSVELKADLDMTKIKILPRGEMNPKLSSCSQSNYCSEYPSPLQNNKSQTAVFQVTKISNAFKTASDGLQSEPRLLVDSCDRQTHITYGISTVVTMACGGTKQEKVRLCWKGSVCFNDCNSNVAKIFRPPPYSVSYISATQVCRIAT